MLPMFKVKEVAATLKVSRQNIYYWIDKLKDKELKGHIYKHGNASVIDKEGIKVLKDKMNIQTDVTGSFTEHDQKGDKQHATNTDIKELKESIKKLESNYTELVTTLQRQLEIKDQQLENKDRQFENFQVLLKQNQEKILELEGEAQERKKPLLERLKWWKK